MRLLPLIFLLVPMTAQAGELPADPMLQLLIRGQSAPVEVEHEYLFGASEAPLAEMAGRLSASVREEGRGDYRYACAVQGGRAIWFLSDASDSEGEPMLTAMVLTPAPGPGIGCDAVAELPQAPAEGEAPGVGASLADIESYFVEAILALEARSAAFEVSSDGLVAFRSHDVLGDGGDSWEMIKTVTYHLTDEVVDAVAYEIVTVR